LEIEFKGVAAMREKLLKLRNSVAGPATEKAVREGAEIIRTAMREAAPVLDEKTANSTALPPGSLKKGIRIRMKQEGADTQAAIGPSAKVRHVARFVEEGHRLVKGGQSKIGKGGKTVGPGEQIGEVQAYPFLRPAFESSIAGAEEAIVNSLNGSIAEALK
jgi:HK97 gp10 family phage protein